MSFLNSVLSSIGGREQGKPTQMLPASTSNSLPEPHVAGGNTFSSSIHTTFPALQASAPSLKRKADPSTYEASVKSQRTESCTITSHPKAVPAPASQARPQVKPSSITIHNDTQPSTSKVASITTRPISYTSRTAAGNVKLPPPKAITSAISTASPAKPAPKGSYQAILERAQAAKAKQAEAGTVKHKPTAPAPKLSKRERLAQEAQAAEKAKLEARPGKGMKIEGRPGVISKTTGKSILETKERKKQPVDLGYKGTMRPAPSGPSYKGTAKAAPSPATTSRMPDRSVPKRPPDCIPGTNYKYASYSDEDEDEEDEEEDDVDEESDMEGGFDDMQEEEEQALRIAKREDERASREEAEHKRLKAEKRKKLEQLVASRRR